MYPFQVVPVEQALKLLSARFCQTQGPRPIFLVDEVDKLQNRKQSVLYNIFEWPSMEGGPIMVAISNTVDLPERTLDQRVASRLGLTRLQFLPYSASQLQQILACRLQGLAVFEVEAIELVARKVSSLSGDARRALEICCQAAELAETAGLVSVTSETVLEAYGLMFSSPKVEAIR